MTARGGLARSKPTAAAAGVAVRTDPLGGDALVSAAVSGATPPGWYTALPRDRAGWVARIEAVRGATDQSGWLDALWPAINAEGPAAARLRRAAVDGVVVTTGQQPGLFGGPIYTWSKAVGALALADALERTCGIPVAPLFWAATDDSDFDEASTTWVSVVGGAQSLTVRPIAAPGTVLASALLADVGPAMTDLVAASGSASYAAALDAVRAAYASAGHDGRAPTAGAAFVALLRRLLAPLGIPVLDASHGAVRRRAFPLLQRALERADAVRDALADRAQALTAAGFRPKVRDVGDLSLVFGWSAPGGGSVDRDGPAPLGAARARIPRAKAAEMAAAGRPGTLSANVLLRPVVERAILPTVAYLAGPGEIAYFAQTSAVAQTLDAAPPLAVPRWSGTVIEPPTAALLSQYDITPDELRDPHAPETRLARAAIPASTRGSLEALRAAVEQGIDALEAADASGLVKSTVIGGARAHLLHRLERLERRYTAASKLREAAALRDVATLRGALAPDGKPQERRLNFIPFLARSGPALLEAMRAAAAPARRRAGGRRTIGEPLASAGSAAAPAAGDRAAGRGGGSAASLVAAGIMLSRLAGLVRERVLAHYFGSAQAADAVRAAFRIPNLLQNLFGEGALSASFIPVYARLLARGEPNEARRVAGAVAALLALVVSVVVLAGVLATPFIIDLIAPGFTGSRRALTIVLVRIFFPGAGLLVMSAWCLGVLNSHGRFLLSYSAPVVWNAALIATLLLFGGHQSVEQLAVSYAWGSVVASALMFAIQLPLVLRLTRGISLRPHTDSPEVRTVARNFGPVFVTRGVVQLSAYVDQFIASWLPVGSVALIGYAQNLSLLPVSLFGMAVSAAELPAMAGVVGAAGEVAATLRSRLDAGLRRIAFYIVPSAVAFVALGDVVAAAVYRTGRFTAADALWVWAILAGSAVGLLASTLGRLYSSAYYALRDTRTPLRYAVLRVTLTTGLGYLCALPLPRLLGVDPRWGMAGLTASAGVAGWVEFTLLRRGLRSRVGSTGVPANLLATLWASAAVAGAAAYGTGRWLGIGHPIWPGRGRAPALRCHLSGGDHGSRRRRVHRASPRHCAAARTVERLTLGGGSDSSTGLGVGPSRAA